MNYKTIFIFGFFLLHLTSSANVAEDPVIPPARWGHVLIYYPPEDQLLLFGGASERKNYLGDTWIYRAGKWKKMNVAGPTARGFSAITFHEKRNTILLHGGRGNKGVTYSDLWEWDGKKWSKLESRSAYKADHHQMEFVPEMNAILAFGGWNGEDVMGDTWIWEDSWIKSEMEGPPKRASFGMTYHESKEKLVLFGGLWVKGQYADHWEWHNGKWQQIGGNYDNSSLDHHAMVYDNYLDSIFLFGGKDYRYKPQNKTLSISENAVEYINYDGPQARHSTGMAYAENAKFTYLFGGKMYKNDEQLPLGDFWKWNGKEWQLIFGK